MSQPTFTLDTLTLTGTPRQMGQAHGEALRERIQAFVEVRFGAVTRYAEARRRTLLLSAFRDIARQCQAIRAEWDPAGHEEHLGVAEGANVDPVDLYAITNMTDMRDVLLINDGPADPEGCSSVLLPPGSTANQQRLVGQTWDLNPTDVDFIYAFHRKPTDGPETWSISCSGCLTLIGMNEHGVSVGTTNIKVVGSKPGVGYLDILHRIVRARSASEASELVKNAPRAGAHTYWIADADTAMEWETSPRGEVLRDAAEAPVWRTNHCLVPDHVDHQGEHPSPSSFSRFNTLNGLLTDRSHFDVESLKTVFADRSEGVLSINRYHEDEMGTATNAVFIAEPSTRRVYACRGPADRGEWVTFQF